MHEHEHHENALACTLTDHRGTTAADIMRACGLTPRMFSLPRAACVVAAAFRLREKGVPCDIPNLQSEVGAEAEAFGGSRFLYTMDESVISSDSIPFHAEIVRRTAASRAVRSKAHTLAAGDATEEECAAILAECQQELIGFKKSDESMLQIVGSIMQDIDDKMNGKAETVWPSGLVSLDNMLDGGFRQGELVVIAAYPGKGKSALMGQIALESSEKRLRSLILSAEMPPKQVVRRLLACMMGRELSVFRTKMPVGSELQDIGKAGNKLAQLDISVRGCQQMAQAIAEATVWAKKGAGLVAIDYLQRFDGGSDFDSRELCVAAMARGAKNLALTTLSPVLLGSQLNDDGKLRESRAIGQEADIILMIHDNKITVDKNRDGRLGDLPIISDFRRMRFIEGPPLEPEPEKRGSYQKRKWTGKRRPDVD